MKTALHKMFNSYKSRGIVKAAGRGGGSLTLSVMPPKTMPGCRRDLGAHGTAHFASQSQAVPANRSAEALHYPTASPGLAPSRMRRQDAGQATQGKRRQTNDSE
jgi:hypothetical protein